MHKIMIRFFRAEAGNASLDWTVLMVAVAGMAVLMVGLLNDEATSITNETAIAIESISLDPS